MVRSQAASPASHSILSRIVDRVWWFFTSVRVALWLIGTTIGWVLIATLAQSTFPTKLAQFIPALAPLMRQWSNWEVWQSPPFLVTLGTLAISIILGGMVARWPGIVQRVWQPNVRTSAGFFNAVKHSESFTVATAQEGVDAFNRVLGGKRYRLRAYTDEAKGATHLYADRNRFTPLATFPFHTGLVAIMIGAVVIASLGWREIGFLVPDGATRAVGHNTGLTVKNDGFVDDYYDDGRAKDYYSDLQIYKDGQPIKSGRLRVNSPISVGAVSFHQATYGQAAKFQITDAATGKVVYDDSVPVIPPGNRTLAAQFTDGGGEVRAIGVQRLDDLGVTLRVVGSGGSLDQNIGTGQMAIAVFDNRATKQGAGPIGIATLDPGGSTTIGGLRFTFQREVRFTGLQITYAPGLWIIILAAATIFFSTLVTFYLPQRRIRALVAPQPDGTMLMRLGAQLKLDLFGPREFEEISRAVREGLDIPTGTEDSGLREQPGEVPEHAPAVVLGD